MKLCRYIPVIIAVFMVIGLQMLLISADKQFYMVQITMSAYYALVVIGLCLLMGYTGQVSLGHAGFFAIGAYTCAVLSTYNLNSYRETSLIKLLESIGFVLEHQDIYGAKILSFSPWIGFIVSVFLTGLIALLIGMPVVRLKGHYLAMATLGFGLIVYRVVLGTRIFGQADGISNIPPMKLFLGWEVNGRTAFLIQNYYISWFAVLLIMALAINLVHSRVGRALCSIHQNEEAAESLGVNAYRYKLFVFVLSALFASIGGVLMTHYNGSIGPSEVTVMKSVRYVAIVAVGGMANLWGSMLMGIILNFLSLRGVFGSYDDAVFGAILIFIMLFAPNGLLKIPVMKTVTNFLSRRKNE